MSRLPPSTHMSVSQYDFWLKMLISLNSMFISPSSLRLPGDFSIFLCFDEMLNRQDNCFISIVADLSRIVVSFLIQNVWIFYWCRSISIPDFINLCLLAYMLFPFLTRIKIFSTTVDSHCSHLSFSNL